MFLSGFYDKDENVKSLRQKRWLRQHTADIFQSESSLETSANVSLKCHVHVLHHYNFDHQINLYFKLSLNIFKKWSKIDDDATNPLRWLFMLIVCVPWLWLV